jgi:hypothetical protein
MARLPTYSLLKDGILVTTNTLEGTQEHLVDYEALGYRMSRYASHSIGRLYLALFFTLVTAGVSIVLLQGGDAEKVAPIVWGVIAAGFWFYYSRSRLHGSRFMSNIGTFTLLGTRERLQPLVDELPAKKRICIETRLSSRLDMTDWRHASGYLVGLRENGVISDEDFDALVIKYDLSPKETGEVIGFSAT